MGKYQENRSVKITSPFGPNVLVFARMSSLEHVSQPFHCDLELLSDKGDLDPDKILGKPLVVSLATDTTTPVRFFHGLVTEFEQTGYGERMHQYRAVTRPWFWFLTRTADCRIFQGKTAPDIFKQVCQQVGFSDVETRLGSYKPYDYCVQYRETDFNFLSRLLEHEGIFYFFEHSENKHVMVLADDAGKCKPAPGYDSVPFYPATLNEAARTRDHLQQWSFQKSFQTGSFAARDYNFQQPTSAPAGASSISRPHNPTKYEIYDYPVRSHGLTSGGVEALAKLRVQELQVPQMVARGSGDAAGLAAGKVFKLTGFPRANLNMQYLITSSAMELTGNTLHAGASTAGSELTVSVEAVDAREPYRPARVTPKPMIHGSQTAVVVGPKGDEIHTDEFGRVKVQFHWDRYGKNDETSSCFIRVGQLWAGKQWGGMHIPRIGQEVIVSFLEGDPDDPLIIGSVYNGANKPPWSLPDNKTQSGILSRSSLSGTADNANEFRFEDKKGSEMVLLHAEKDQTIEVEHDESHSIGHDQTHSVGNDRKKDVKNNETTSIGKNRTESVGGNETISISKDRSKSVDGTETVDIGKDYTQNIGGSRTVSVTKDESIEVSGNRSDEVTKSEEGKIGKNRTYNVGEKDSLSVGKQLLIDAGDEVVIQTGSASLTMKKDGTITLKGADITLDGSGKINVKASSDVVLKGSKISQN